MQKNQQSGKEMLLNFLDSGAQYTSVPKPAHERAKGNAIKLTR